MSRDPGTRVHQTEHTVRVPPYTVSEAIAGVGIKTVYQPIVALHNNVTIGYEALTRWPEDNNSSPETIFRLAGRLGQVDELDRICITSAINTAQASRLPHGSLLLINSEPATAFLESAAGQLVHQAKQRLQLMFEITERSLLAHPHTLLQKVAAFRASGIGIALDDVGVQPDSLALLDVISPDIVKLGIDLVQNPTDYGRTRALAGVLAHHERTGAVILAEGIETPQHLEHALALGATLGQGYYFGKPSEKMPTATVQGSSTAQWSILSPKSPFGLFGAKVPSLRTARKPVLTAFSRHIEAQALNAVDPPIVLTALQHAEYFDDHTRQRYTELAERCPLVAVFGKELPAELGNGIRGVKLDPSDPLSTQWTVLILGPHVCAALIADEHPGSSPDTAEGDRLFDFGITFDRGLVTAAARSMLDRNL